MSTNLYSLFDKTDGDKMDGLAVLAGTGPCTHLDLDVCQGEKSTVSSSAYGYEDKPVFFYSGSADTTVPRNVSVLSSEYH